MLNGPLVRLGEAADLVRTDSAFGRIGLDLSYAKTDEDAESAQVFAIHANLSPSSDNGTLHAVRLELSRPTEDGAGSLILDRSRSRGADLEAALAIATGGEEFLHVKDTFSNDKQALRTYVRMEGLEPVEVIQLSSPDGIRTKYRKAITTFLDDVSAGKYDVPQRISGRNADEFTAYRVVSEFIELIDSALESNSVEGPEIREILDVPRSNPFLFARDWNKQDEILRNRVIDLAVEERSARPYIRVWVESQYLYRPRSSWLQVGVLERQFMRTYSESLSALVSLAEALNSISSRVEYLGPLRDEPRVVWNQWNELARGLPVGTRGEFSAVRLSQSADRDISYCRPNGEATVAPLGQAVNEWLGYLQIGESVSATSEGKLGVRLELELAGHGRDLTAVGVGVSQALPLVVAMLAVDTDSIFIVEQPELHLHPAVQARLADFIVVARPALTCLVETHSEAFVTRIRRRVAEGLIPTDRVNIIFVEPGESGSTMRHLALSESGDLSDWPAGFISGEDEDAKAILSANIARIRKP